MTGGLRTACPQTRVGLAKACRQTEVGLVRGAHRHRWDSRMCVCRGTRRLARLPKNRKGHGRAGGAGVCTPSTKNSDGPRPERACGGRCWVPGGWGRGAWRLARLPKNCKGHGWAGGAGVCAPSPKNSGGPRPKRACGGRCWVPGGWGGRRLRGAHRRRWDSCMCMGGSSSRSSGVSSSSSSNGSGGSDGGSGGSDGGSEGCGSRRDSRNSRASSRHSRGISGSSTGAGVRGRGRSSNSHNSHISTILFYLRDGLPSPFQGCFHPRARFLPKKGDGDTRITRFGAIFAFVRVFPVFPPPVSGVSAFHTPCFRSFHLVSAPPFPVFPPFSCSWVETPNEATTQK